MNLANWLHDFQRKQKRLRIAFPYKVLCPKCGAVMLKSKPVKIHRARRYDFTCRNLCIISGDDNLLVVRIIERK